MAPKRRWTTEQLQQALKELDKGTAAAEIKRKYGISLATLSRAKNGSTTVGKRPGPSTLLTAAEEQILYNMIIRGQEKDQCLPTRLIIDEATRLLRKRESTGGKRKKGVKPKSSAKATRAWCKGFLRRHPDLAKRKADPLDRARREANPEKVKNYFDILEGIFRQYPHLPSSNILNLDETHVSAWDSSRIVFARKGSKRVKSAENTNREGLTLCLAVSAAGTLFSPFMVVKGSRSHYPRWWSALTPLIMRWGGLRTARIAQRDKAWINGYYLKGT